MSRGRRPLGRCLAVWIAATVALLTAWWLAAGAAASLTSVQTWQRGFEDLLVSLCAAVLLGCAARLWLVTTATTLALARGRLPRDPHGVMRRLVLAACGAAVVAGVSAPATAGQGGDLERLAGLPLPDRATAGHPTGPASTARPLPARPATVETPAGDAVVVRVGDSLWSLAASRLPASATHAEVDRAWRAVYAANRAEIGADPGLIRPGQRLHLPTPTPTATATDEGGER